MPFKKPLYLASLSILLSFASVSGARNVPGTDNVQEVRLYAMDCGQIDAKDMGLFSDTGDFDGKSGRLPDPCFLSPLLLCISFRLLFFCVLFIRLTPVCLLHTSFLIASRGRYRESR